VGTGCSISRVRTPHFPQSLADHQRRFGKPPWLVAGIEVSSHPPMSAWPQRPASRTWSSRMPARHRPNEGSRRNALVPSGFRFRAGVEGGCWDGATGWTGARNTERRAWVATSAGDHHQQPGQDRRDGGRTTGEDGMIHQSEATLGTAECPIVLVQNGE
jgi:hypothetical protein